MRSLSLAAVAATSLFVFIGLGQAAQVGVPSRAWAAHRTPASAHPVKTQDETADYIVRLRDAPVASYGGGIPGYPATSPRYTGARFLDVDAPAASSYAVYLAERQSEVLDTARRSLGRTLSPRFQYRYALNGVSLRLDRAEAMHIARLPGVLSVEPVRHFRPVTAVGLPATVGDTNASRAWINAPTVWQLQTTTSTGGTDNEGEGMVLADLDTGINHANSSFAATGPKDGYVVADPGSKRFGVCDTSNTAQHGQEPTFFACNNKLIGAYTYTQDSGNDPNSPEDSEGHGSHTASTVVGDFVDVPMLGSTTPVSGVAPHASVIAYDVCDPTDLCGTDQSVAAVDQAIKDQTALKNAWGTKFKGMVLNFSIGGGEDAYSDPVEQAFLSAVEAGIYVSAAAGNGGPSNAVDNDPVNFPQYPVEHVGPWVASVAAATHNGTFTSNDLENFNFGDSATRPAANMVGVGITQGFGPSLITYAGNGTFDGDDPIKTGNAPTSGEPYPTSLGTVEDTKQCLYPFIAGSFTGKIVVCDRGTVALVDKAYNVMKGGASGVVIAATSTSNQDMPAEAYVIPGTLISQADGDTLRTWLVTAPSIATAAAQISGTTLTTDPSEGDQLAGFSSRGPTETSYDDLVKPDLTAPGVSVLAAVSNPKYTDGCSSCSSQPESYDFYDGTSMATPHDSGAAALLMQAHPGWTPAEVKSALMLTAVTAGLIDQCASLDSGKNCVAGAQVPSPQVRGAGRVDVDAAERTGLVMDESGMDYEAADPGNGGDLTDLNLPSLGNRGCAVGCGWTRSLTSAFSSATVNYSVSISGATSGLQLSVSPTTFSLAPGQSQTLTITADTGGVASGKWAFGEVDITTSDTGDGGAAIPAMHLPVAVQAVVPTPHMSIDQQEFDYSVAQGASDQRSFTISNNGQKTLSWTLTTNGGPATQGNAPLGSTGVTQAPLGSLWSQPLSGSNFGYPSSYYTQSKQGVYVADTFNLPIKGSVSKIVAQGFAQDGSGPVAVSGSIGWYVYADVGGKPAGDPDDGKADFVWHYSGSAAAAGIDTGNGVITLDLAKAGAPALSLASGQYWLIVAPTFNAKVTDASAATWYWFEGKPTGTVGEAQFIDPGNVFGDGTDWQPLNLSFAFSLSGSLNCANTGMQGLSFSIRSGNVKAGGSESVTASFKGGTLAPGNYAGAVCVSGNASDHPLIVLPVYATVTGGSGGGSGGGGGGGGSFDLLVLATLSLILRRRLAKAM
jgi:subtilisin family serine protease